MARCPFAEWREITGRSGNYLGDPFKIVHHTTEGASAADAFDAFRRKRSDPHFTVDAQRIYQHFDTDQYSRSLKNPDGGVETNRDSAIQIEVVGFAHIPKGAATLENVARLCRWIERTHGVPRVWPNGLPKPAKNGRDPGGHNRDPKVWDTQGGHYGHCHVPENDHWDPGYTADEVDYLMTAEFDAEFVSEPTAKASAAKAKLPAMNQELLEAARSTMPDHADVDAEYAGGITMTVPVLEPLYLAIQSGDLADVQRHIANGVNVVAARPVQHPNHPMQTTEMTPLGWTAWCSAQLSPDAVHLIIQALLGANADATIKAPLLHATSAAAIELLADAGADPQVSLADGPPLLAGTTPLMFRAQASDHESVRILLVLGVDASRKNASNLTALDYAVRGNGPIQDAADVDRRTMTLEALSLAGLPSLTWSQAMLSVAVLNLLVETTIIENGPNGPVEKVVYSRAPISVRPILEALEFNGGNPADAVEPGAGSQRRNLLMLMLENFAFRYEPFDEIIWLLRRYGFLLLEQSDAKGRSLLHHVFAPPRGIIPLPNPETRTLVRALMAFGANPNFRDNTGASPLHEMVRNACRPKDNLSPYPWSCDPPGATRPPCAECIESARIMIAAGAESGLQDFKGSTPAAEARALPNCPLRNVLPLPRITPRAEGSAKDSD